MPLLSSLGRFEAHRLEIIPARRIIRHGYAVLIAQDDAGAVEHAPDRRIEFACGFRLGLPNETERRSHIHRRYFVYGTIEQLFAIEFAEVAFPLMPSFRADGLAYRILDDELCDLSEGRDGRLS